MTLEAEIRSLRQAVEALAERCGGCGGGPVRGWRQLAEAVGTSPDVVRSLSARLAPDQRPPMLPGQPSPAHYSCRDVPWFATRSAALAWYAAAVTAAGEGA